MMSLQNSKVHLSIIVCLHHQLYKHYNFILGKLSFIPGKIEYIIIGLL